MGTDVRTSYIDGTGAILGYSNSFSDGFGSGIFYENANFEPLGNSFTSSDGFTSTFVKGVLTANGSVIGSTETITESEADGSYSRTSVMKFDTTGKMIGQTETITSGGATVVTEYDANNNIVGSFDGNGNLLDPLAVFQIGSMVFESGVEQAYANSLGNTMFIDDDGNGVNDVLEVDSDQNGITDIHEDYATYILNSAILSPSFKPEPIMSADGTSVTGFITANNEFYVQLNGTFQGGIDSPPTGFVSEIIVKSSVISASGYDGADGVNYTGGSLISTSTGLNVDVSTLVAFIDAGSAPGGSQGGQTGVDLSAFDVLVDGDSPSTVNISVTADGGVFSIGGNAQQTLDLTEGNTYVFSYPAGHPFALSTTDDGTHGSGVEYTDGVVRDATGNTLTYTVPSDAPSLYYYCTDHSGMGGVANTPSPSDDGINWSADGELILSGLLSGTFAPQPQPLVDAHDGSVIGVLVSDGHLYLKIVNSGDVVTAMTVNQVSDDSVVAKIDPSSNTLTTMTKLTSAFPRLDVSNVAVAGDTSSISSALNANVSLEGYELANDTYKLSISLNADGTAIEQIDLIQVSDSVVVATNAAPVTMSDWVAAFPQFGPGGTEGNIPANLDGITVLTDLLYPGGITTATPIDFSADSDAASLLVGPTGLVPLASGFATAASLVDGSDEAWPGHGIALGDVVLGTAADGGVTPWPGADAAAQTLLDSLLAATPDLVMGSSVSTTVVSATYTVGTDQLVVTYADDANGFATGIAVNDLSTTVLREIALSGVNEATYGGAVDQLLATTPVDDTTNGVHTSVYTDVNEDVEFTLVITYSDASATGVATNVVLSHEHSLTNEVMVVSDSGDITASGITPAVMLGHATIAVNSTADVMNPALNHGSMIADSAAVVANKTVLAGLLAEPVVLTNNGEGSPTQMEAIR